MELFSSQVCRTCMIEEKENRELYFIYDFVENSSKSIADLLLTTNPLLHIDAEDELPKTICIHCLKTLVRVVDFEEMCVKSQFKLRRMLNEGAVAETQPVTITENMLLSDPLAKEVTIIEDVDPLQKNYCSVRDEEVSSSGIEGSTKEQMCNVDMEVVDESHNLWEESAASQSSAEDNEMETDLTSRKSKEQINANNIGDLSCTNNFGGQMQYQTGEKNYAHPEKNVQLNASEEREHVEVQASDDEAKRLSNTSSLAEEDDKWVERKTIYVCGYCNQNYKILKNLREHLCVHTGDRPYLCFECGKRFYAAGTFRLHLKRHSGRTLECPDCPKKFKGKTDLNSHKAVHMQIGGLICEICGVTFKKPLSLKLHIMAHKGETPHKCKFCDMRFTLVANVRRHERTHTGEKPFKCKYCLEVFSQSNNLNDHLRKHIGDNIYKCELCPQRFPFVKEMREHFASHKNDDEETRLKNLKAREEDEDKLKQTIDRNVVGFKQRVKLKSAAMKSLKQKRSNDRKYRCELCDRVFTSSNRLLAHLQRHENKNIEKVTPDNECPDCPEKFPSYESLYSHRAVHAKIKEYSCDVCGAAFARRVGLKMHEIRHKGEKPYKCAYCDMRFYTSSNMQRHQRTHTDEKPFKCEFCVKAFKQHSNLREHLRTHLGKNIYRCKLCPQRFSLAREVRQHFATHKNDDEATRLRNLSALKEESIALKSI